MQRSRREFELEEGAGGELAEGIRLQEVRVGLVRPAGC